MKFQGQCSDQQLLFDEVTLEKRLTTLKRRHLGKNNCICNEPEIKACLEYLSNNKEVSIVGLYNDFSHNVVDMFLETATLSKILYNETKFTID